MAAVLCLKPEVVEDDRPHLELMETNAAPVRQGQRRLKHGARRNRWESFLFVCAAFAIVAFFAVGAVQSLYRAASAATNLSAPLAVTVPVTVHSGDTLWAYAQKYGASNTYILDRVENIALVNHLAPTAALVPGEHLRVPVTNPVLLAKLEDGRRLASRTR